MLTAGRVAAAGVLPPEGGSHVSRSRLPGFRLQAEDSRSEEYTMSDAPKSSLDLVMERLRKKDAEAGVTETTLTDEQRKAIAEARSVYDARVVDAPRDRKSTRLNSSHLVISYAVFCSKTNS